MNQDTGTNPTIRKSETSGGWQIQLPVPAGGATLTTHQEAKRLGKVVVVLPNGEKKTIEFPEDVRDGPLTLTLGELVNKIDKSILDPPKVKGLTTKLVNYLSESDEHGHDVGRMESKTSGHGSEKKVIEVRLYEETNNVPNVKEVKNENLFTILETAQTKCEVGPQIRVTIPLRRLKKESLNYALKSCNRQLLTTILSSKDDVDLSDGLDVLTCIKRTREAFRDGISPLQGAVTLGHYNICKHLLHEGVLASSASNHILNPLCQALWKGHYDIAHLLIEFGANVNIPYDDSFPMNYALEGEKCTVEIVGDIIDAGFRKNSVIHLVNKRTALHVAVKMNHFKIVDYLLSLSVNPNVKDCMGLTPLHYAVQISSPSIVELLARNGADLNCECQEYFTPLLYSIVVGNYEMVKLLLSFGADIHFVTGSKKCSMMPLHFAANCCQLKITQLLLENGAGVNKVVPMTGETPLHAAARATCEKNKQSKIALDCIVQLLIKEGANLKARHKFGFTPLHVALKAKNISLSKILIVNGSELNNGMSESYTTNIYTTFHVAAKILDKELIQLCCEYGANCLAEDDEGMFPCHLSLLTAMMDLITTQSDPTTMLIESQIQRDLTPIFKIFWKHKFPFDLTLRLRWLDKNDGMFPPQLVALMQLQKILFRGLKTMQPKMVQKAIAQGAEVKCCSTDIPNPLHYIAAKGNETIMREFLSRGVPVNLVDKRGETPLHLAAKAGYVNCCLLLLEYGAVYNYSSFECPRTPLKMAQDNGHTEVVTLLVRIGRYFKEVRTGHFRKLKPEMKIFKAVMNCSCRDGMSLLARAMHLDQKETIERLMKLRQVAVM